MKKWEERSSSVSGSRIWELIWERISSTCAWYLEPDCSFGSWFSWAQREINARFRKTIISIKSAWSRRSSPGPSLDWNLWIKYIKRVCSSGVRWIQCGIWVSRKLKQWFRSVFSVESFVRYSGSMERMIRS